MKTKLHSLHIEEWAKAHNTIEHLDTIPTTLGSEAVLNTVEIKFKGLINVEVMTDFYKTFMFEFSVFGNNDTVGEILNIVDTLESSFNNKRGLHGLLSVMCGLLYNNYFEIEEGGQEEHDKSPEL